MQNYVNSKEHVIGAMYENLPNTDKECVVKELE
jgi:hypothetical protein